MPTHRLKDYFHDSQHFAWLLRFNLLPNYSGYGESVGQGKWRQGLGYLYWLVGKKRKHDLVCPPSFDWFSD